MSKKFNNRPTSSRRWLSIDRITRAFLKMTELFGLFR